jgi:type I restriction enzyme R subunit
MKPTSEKAFEDAIETVLLGFGFRKHNSKNFDQERAIFPEEAVGFIRNTQPKEWAKLEALHGDKTAERVVEALCKWMDTHGVLATLRHGFKCYGRTLRIAYFKPAHGLNPDLEARYAANRLGITRQLFFSPKTGESLDVALERHSSDDVGIEESAYWLHGGGCHPPIPARPRPAGEDL